MCPKPPPSLMHSRGPLGPITLSHLMCPGPPPLSHALLWPPRPHHSLASLSGLHCCLIAPRTLILITVHADVVTDALSCTPASSHSCTSPGLPTTRSLPWPHPCLMLALHPLNCTSFIPSARKHHKGPRTTSLAKRKLA